MTAARFFSDYHGRTWRYAMLLRPLSVFNLPHDFREHMLLETPAERPVYPQYPHGTVPYAVELPADVVAHFSLELVEVTEQGK